MKYKATIQITLGIILHSDKMPNLSDIEQWARSHLLPSAWVLYSITRKEVEVVKVEEV